MTKLNKGRGRPTKYNKKIAQEICNTIASTSKGTKKLCKENKHWPCQDTLFNWLKNNKEFSEQYAQAKKCQIDVLVDEILEISDNTSEDYIFDENNKLILNRHAINRARLKVDTRKWLACKLVPKIYGNNNLIQINQETHEDKLLKLDQELFKPE